MFTRMCFLLGPNIQGTAVCLECGILCWGTWGRCCCPQARSVYRGWPHCSSSFTGGYSPIKAPWINMTCQGELWKQEGPTSLAKSVPVITRGNRNFHVSIHSFPSTAAVPPSQIPESCYLYFCLFSAALQVGDTNPCSSWAAGVPLLPQECYWVLLLPFKWSAVKNFGCGR